MRQLHSLINQAIREAVRLKYIRMNPLEGVKPPKQTHKEKDVLTPEQVRHLHLIPKWVAARYIAFNGFVTDIFVDRLLEVLIGTLLTDVVKE